MSQGLDDFTFPVSRTTSEVESKVEVDVRRTFLREAITCIFSRLYDAFALFMM